MNEPRIIHPRLNTGRILEFLSPSKLGYPMFARRSRMSDARRFWPDPDACARAEAKVQAGGGPAFFDRPNWRQELSAVLETIPGRWETDAERAGEIEEELVLARDEIERRIGTPVRHACLPWGISGSVTRAALERVGMATAFANRLSGRLAVAEGDEPFFLKRLDNRFIFALPGTGRRSFPTLA